MVYLIWAGMGILSCVWKKNRIVMLLVAAFIACMFCFNTASADIGHYELQYLGQAKFTNEPCYLLLINVCRHFHLDFRVYHALYALIALPLIVSTICRFSPYPAWTLFFYSIYPMTLDITQLRFFIAYSFAFFAFRFLLDYQVNQDFKNIVYFVLCVACATGFHYACVFYLIGLTLFFDIRKHRLLVFLFVPLACLVFFLSIGEFSSLIFSILGGRKTSWDLSVTRDSSLLRTFYIPIMRGALLAFAILTSFVIRKRRYASIVGKNENSLGISYKPNAMLYALNTSKSANQYDLRINRCLFLSILYIWGFSTLELSLGGNYERLSRLGLLLGLLLISRQISYLNASNKQVAFLLFTALYGVYFLLSMFFMRSDTGRYFGYVFRQVMESNGLFGVTY